MHHHRLVLSRSFGPNQRHQVQEVRGVVGNSVVRPGQVLDLSQLPRLLALDQHIHKTEGGSPYTPHNQRESDHNLSLAFGVWSVTSVTGRGAVKAQKRKTVQNNEELKLS